MIHVEINVSEKFTEKVILTASFKHANQTVINRYLKNINKSFNSGCYIQRVLIININNNQKPKTNLTNEKI